MVAILFAKVELEPITVETEGYTAGSKILREHVLELLGRDVARTVTGKRHANMRDKR